MVFGWVQGQESLLPGQTWPQPGKHCRDTQVRAGHPSPCQIKDVCEAYMKFMCFSPLRNSLRSSFSTFSVL